MKKALVRWLVTHGLVAPWGGADVVSFLHEPWPGYRYETYQWEGRPWWPLRVSRELLAEVGGGQALNDRLPWPLAVYRDDYARDYVICLRTDGVWRVYAALAIALAWPHQRWLWVSVRVIVTANIWGIGYHEEHTVPSWRDLFRRRPAWRRR